MGILRNLLNVSKLAAKSDWQRYHQASRAFVSEGDWARAALWGRMAAVENPASAEVWNDFGFALNGLAQAEWDGAPKLPKVPQAPKATEVAPTERLPRESVERGDAGIRAALAQAEAVTTWEEAANAFARALSIKPDFAEAHNNYGIALLKSGRLYEGRAAFAEALRLKPNYANAKANLAFADGQIAQLSTPD